MEPTKKTKDFTLEERREYNRLSKQRQRQRERKQREQNIEEQEIEETAAEYQTKNLHFFGEESPGVDAKTHDSELKIHREFLRAMDQPDVQPGETLRQLAKRTWEAWLNQTTSWTCSGDERKPNPPDAFLTSFNRTKQKFDGLHGFDGTHWRNETFENIWRPPKDCTGDEPIDVSTLPPLPHRQSMSELKHSPIK